MAIKFERNTPGFDQLRLAYEAEVRAKAERLAAEANSIPSTTSPAATEPYYEVVEDNTPHRARYRVETTSIRARRHDTKTQALLRARAAVSTGD